MSGITDLASAAAFLGEGDVLADVWDDATQTWWGGWKAFGEATKFAIKANTELLEKESRARGKRGQLVASVALLKAPEIEIVFGELNVDTARLAFMGTSAALSQSAGTIGAGAKITARQGMWVPVGFRNLTAAGFAVTEDTDTTPDTYVLGTDYEVNWRLGTVRALPGGAIADKQLVRIAGAYSAVDGTVIKGATKPQLRARFFLDGRNLVDGSDAECEVFEAVVAPNSEFDFMADDFGELTLAGKLVTPIGKDSPFEVRFPRL